MPVLSRELVGGREGVEVVAVSASGKLNAAGETLWQSTTTHGTNTVVVDKAVAGNQADKEVTDARVEAAGTV